MGGDDALTLKQCMQWFGDLVTPDWWGEVWLKEGFASYFEALGATAANPNLAVLETFYGDETSRALVADAKNSSNHALVKTKGVLPSTPCSAFSQRAPTESLVISVNVMCEQQAKHT